MRRRLGVLCLAACLAALIGCSSEETKKEEPKKEAEAPKKEQAPDVFKIKLDTSKGLVVIEVHRDWAPIGADHLYTLVKSGFYDNNYFFRYIRNFIVQFGINGDPKTNNTWKNMNLLDDPVKQTNARGTLTYATAGPRTRSTQLFINLRNNAELDTRGFSPLGKVITGMNVVDSFYAGYGEMPPDGQGPDPGKIELQGTEYLTTHFPKLDYIKKATIE
ncbi:MAG TPA: peptidylprolyl isomerase [Bryobacteraceae bacterium]|nr:peptidylprolyl isomerase [Bryobacteraceae bacterium]